MVDEIRELDCIVCGSCTVDILVKPVDLQSPIGPDRLFPVQPIEATTGGIVSNSGTALARMGMKTAAFTFLGDDEWASIVRRRLGAEGIDTCGLQTHDSMPTSATVVMIEDTGQRSFAHCQGAPKRLSKADFLSNLDLFARSHFMLLGYFSLLPDLEKDLAEVMDSIQKVGCRTALDAAGNGGDLATLAPALPFLDVYVPSLGEAVHQTGLEDPHAILQCYRDAGARGLIGIKLGSRGAILSPADGEIIEVPAVRPPGPVVDSTGAGDAFLAGLITGLVRGLPLAHCGRLAAAAGACCVTGMGATSALKNFAETRAIAGF